MYYFTEKEKEILISELSKLYADWRDVLEWDPQTQSPERGSRLLTTCRPLLRLCSKRNTAAIGRCIFPPFSAVAEQLALTDSAE